MGFNDGGTMHFTPPREGESPSSIILFVYNSMVEKGYDPINQIVGYLLSGDPTYITSHNNARYLIHRVNRDELIEELVKFYIDSKSSGE